jgi:hypothetical protein
VADIVFLTHTYFTTSVDLLRELISMYGPQSAFTAFLHWCLTQLRLQLRQEPESRRQDVESSPAHAVCIPRSVLAW